jgi:SAM-dependent methyltransferase
MINTLPQPFGFYRQLTGSDILHFGYWAQPDASLSEAQQALSDLLLADLPSSPKRALDVGCGLGVTAQWLNDRAYDVTALAPSEELIAYARQQHPGPKYLACGFMDVLPELSSPSQYDIILLQESLQYLPDLAGVFAKIKTLLSADGIVLICDEVSYDPATREHSVIHLAQGITTQFTQAGFSAFHHQRIGEQVLPTCRVAVDLFSHGKAELLEIFGTEIEPEIGSFLAGWQWQLENYSQGRLGYEVWRLRLAHES